MIYIIEFMLRLWDGLDGQKMVRLQEQQGVGHKEKQSKLKFVKKTRNLMLERFLITIACRKYHTKRMYRIMVGQV